jgi:hypothetical protein
MAAGDDIRYEKLRVTVDKNHIIAIGERLYAESIELIRELVNNAYDADATSVRVTVNDSRIQVDDNGSGMDLDGLRQYFNIGSDLKVSERRSPRFSRQRIGQFGIGKFASLAAARTFEVFTQRGSFAASVVFDKQEWQTDRAAWELPLTILPPDPARGDGTSVALTNLFRSFEPAEIERILKDGVPLRDAHFAVFLNGRRVMPRVYSGRRLPVMEGCAYGPITGEVFVLSESASNGKIEGIEVKVRQVTVRRETFGLEEWGRDGARVTGELHADFLPITSDRSGFAIDSPEYLAFREVVMRLLDDVRKSIGKIGEKRERIRSSRALNEAIRRLQLALSRNPQFSPFGVV